MRYTDENPNDPNNPDSSIYVPPTGSGGGGGGGCGEGTFAIDIDASGRSLGGATECVDQAEASRRNQLWIAANPGNQAEAPQQQGQAPAGPAPASKPNYGKAPMFTAPQFEWGEKWQAPTMEDAMNDPGYQFRANEGRRALEQSAAARGLLGSGGTLKNIDAWGQNFAKQEYGDVFNRNLTGYNTRFNTAKDIFDRFYTGKKDEYAPKLFEWQTNAHAADLGFAQAWDNYWRSNLTAQDIWGKSA